VLTLNFAGKRGRTSGRCIQKKKINYFVGSPPKKSKGEGKRRYKGRAISERSGGGGLERETRSKEHGKKDFSGKA